MNTDCIREMAGKSFTVQCNNRRIGDWRSNANRSMVQGRLRTLNDMVKKLCVGRNADSD